MKSNHPHSQLPNFIIAGAAKAGTTALWSHLANHPEIALAKQKEPRFFSEEPGELDAGIPSQLGDRLMRGGTYQKGWDWYRSLYTLDESIRVTGEASTIYFVARDAPGLIQQASPSVKLVFLLRDPVARLYSHYWQEHKLGLELPEFSEMVKTDHPRFRFYCRTSHYRENINRFLNLFERDQLLVLTQSGLKANPRETLDRVLRFLELSPQPESFTLTGSYNTQRTPRSRVAAALYTRYRESGLRERMPPATKLLRNLVYRVFSKLNYQDFRYPPLDSKTRQQLAARFQEDVEFVEDWLQTPMASWRS